MFRPLLPFPQKIQTLRDLFQPSKKSSNKKFGDLPEDLIALIFSFASSHELSKLSLLNKYIFKASQNKLLEREKERRDPLLKLIITLFQQRTKDQIHGIMIGDLSKIGNVKPKETYGKISKAEQGIIIVSLSQEVTKQEANFLIEENLYVEDKPSNRRKKSLKEKVVNLFFPGSPAYDTHCTLLGFKVTILDPKMPNGLKNLIADGEIFLDYLFETRHKIKESESQEGPKDSISQDLISPLF